MKKIVLTFGLIAGAILSAMMLATMPFTDEISYNSAMLIGYTTMVVAFLMVFFGIRSYRDNVENGTVSFRRAFTVGIMITAIASVCYVATWRLVYYKLAPDHMDQVLQNMIERERESGATETQLAAKSAEMARFKELYRNPFINVGVTLLEVFPVGMLVTAISAAILRWRRTDGASAVADAVA